MDDLERLGRPGAYRLGTLRAGGAEPARLAPLRPWFARPSYRGPRSAWALAFLAGAAAIAGGAVVGLYVVPLIVGLLAGLVAGWGGWRLRAALPAAALAAVVGWGMALGWQALHARPPGATPPMVAAVAGLAGLPAHGARGVGVTLLAGILQALAGAGLGRVLAARRPDRVPVQVRDVRPAEGGGETEERVRLLGERAERSG